MINLNKLSILLCCICLLGCGDKKMNSSGELNNRFIYQYDEVKPGEFALLIIDKNTNLRVLMGDIGVAGSVENNHFRTEIDSSRFKNWHFDLHDDTGTRIEVKDEDGDLRWD